MSSPHLELVPSSRSSYPDPDRGNTLVFYPNCQESMTDGLCARFFTLRWSDDGISEAMEMIANATPDDDEVPQLEELRVSVYFKRDALAPFRFGHAMGLGQYLYDYNLWSEENPNDSDEITIRFTPNFRTFVVYLELGREVCDEGQPVGGKLELAVDSATVVDSEGKQHWLDLARTRLTSELQDAITLYCFSDCEWPRPELSAQESLDFGTVYCQESVNSELELTNTGSCPLRVDNLLLPPGAFALADDQPTSFSIGSGGSHDVRLKFRAGGTQSQESDTLTIYSEDEFSPHFVQLVANVEAVARPEFNPPQTRIRLGEVVGFASTTIVIQNWGCRPFTFKCELLGKTRAARLGRTELGPARSLDVDLNTKKQKGAYKPIAPTMLEIPEAWTAHLRAYDGTSASIRGATDVVVLPSEHATVTVRFNASGFPIGRTPSVALVLREHNAPSEQYPEEFRWLLMAYVGVRS